MDATIQTGLSAGTYCDIISGEIVNNACTGKSVTVNSDGSARIQISYFFEDPVIAIYIDSKL
jgi:alpha-amylase